MDCSPSGSSVHGISQARMLKWITISFSRGPSQLRDRAWVSCITGRFFTIWNTRETPIISSSLFHNFHGFAWFISTLSQVIAAFLPGSIYAFVNENQDVTKDQKLSSNLCCSSDVSSLIVFRELMLATKFLLIRQTWSAEDTCAFVEFNIWCFSEKYIYIHILLYLKQIKICCIWHLAWTFFFLIEAHFIIKCTM